MPALVRRHEQLGAVYVEAAIVLPILLLVTFASIFFFMCAARHFCLQMFALEIARDISLGLQLPGNEASGCTSLRNSTLSNPPLQEIDLNAVVASRFNQSSGTWRTCAQNRFLLATNNQTYPMSVVATVHPKRSWFDNDFSAAMANTASEGDFVEVTATYPVRLVLGEYVALFGLIPNVNLIGNAVGIIEPPRT